MKGGGEVFKAVDKKYIASVETELDTECKILWCKIVIKGHKTMHFGTFYRPPDT